MTTPEEIWRAALSDMLQNASGRVVLREILFGLAKVEQPVFSEDHGTMTMREGRRSVGRDLRRHIELLDKKGYVGLMNEDIDAYPDGRNHE